jgi:KipI family sensor histidine kinase inhibitor
MLKNQRSSTSHDWILGVRAQGDRCLIVDLGTEIDVTTGLRCLTLAQKIRLAQWPDVVDIVPSFIAVAVYFRPGNELAADLLEGLETRIRALAQTLTDGQPMVGRQIQIPVCYGDQHGPDLEEVAQRMGILPDEVVNAHAGTPSRVFMLGFAPGHPYIGVHDERFNLPRRAVPRTAVPAGSLGIAIRQSTIYPNVLPGGWHIIGATPLRLFNPTAEQPTLLLPGDQIEFVPISSKKFEQLKAQQTVDASVSAR